MNLIITELFEQCIRNLRQTQSLLRFNHQRYYRNPIEHHRPHLKLNNHPQEYYLSHVTHLFLPDSVYSSVPSSSRPPDVASSAAAPYCIVVAKCRDVMAPFPETHFDPYESRLCLGRAAHRIITTNRRGWFKSSDHVGGQWMTSDPMFENDKERMTINKVVPRCWVLGRFILLAFHQYLKFSGWRGILVRQ